MFFHMLRRQVGDATFFNALRRLAAEGSGHRLGWDDFERVFASLSGTDLRWFFRQWVEQAGAPQLSLIGVQAKPGAQEWTVSGRIRQDGEVFRLELPLQLTTAAGETMAQTVRVTGADTPFAIQSASQPRLLAADPSSDLFRRLAAEELPAAVNDLVGPHRPLVVVADGQQELLEAARPLLKGLHWDEAPVVNEHDPAARLPSDRDLLLIGWPSRADLRPPLPEGLAIAAGAPPVWQAGSHSTTGASLFAVFPGGGARSGRVALLQAVSAQAARLSAGKISHYGRYSLLLFDGEGRNLAKLTWEPAASPLKFDFPVKDQP